MQLERTDTGNAIICALATILIMSLIGAGVLMNCTTRYNVTAKQLKAWKEALYAAEAGGDIGFAEVRKLVSNPSPWSADGWTSPAASPAPTPGPSWSKAPITFGQANSLSSIVTVDKLTDAAPPAGTGYDYYRIRATGIARLFGLPRAGMDDAMLAGGTYFKDTNVKANRASARGTGDSLLRKMDFNYDHFIATYGDGDFNSVSLQTVSSPQITRRIELVAVPQMVSFSGALRLTNSFNGPGSAGVVDSYDSKNGAYYFAANNPSDPHYADSRDGDVSVATPNFTWGGPIYGDVSTNGGNVTHSGTQISGTIDNNVPFTIPPLAKPDTTGWSPGPATYIINPPASSTNSATPAQYVYSSSLAAGVTINAALPLTETYVTVVVTGDVNANITIARGVNAKIYFTGNMSTKAANILNNNVDNGVPTNPSRAGHLQFYGVSPPAGTTQTINIDPPGDLYATFYAPGADMTLTGNANVYGAIVAHNFTGNGQGGGNTSFHYDKELATGFTVPVDYRVASFVEDVR